MTGAAGVVAGAAVVLVAAVAAGGGVEEEKGWVALRRAASPGAGGRLEECEGLAPACAPLRAGSGRTFGSQPRARGEPPGDAARRRASLRVVEGCDEPGDWTALPSDGVSLEVAAGEGVEGGAIRLDFDFQGGGGWAAVRRAVELELPENWELSFWVRGESPPENLEVKLVAPGEGGAENVWWLNRRDYEFPGEWRRVRIKKRQVSFAWGPAGGGEPEGIEAIELAITAGSGGKGTVWIDQVELRELPPERAYAGTPVATASSSAAGEGAERVLDGDAGTAWRSDAEDAEPWLAIDFGEPREYGGLVVEWAGGARAAAYDVEVSDDGAEWRMVRAVKEGGGGGDYLALPEGESRYVRFSGLARSDEGGGGEEGGGPGFAVAEVRVEPLAFGESANTLYRAMAADAPRGDYPRYLAGEQSYWTVVGADGDGVEALLGEDGAVEPFAGGFSIEPFVGLAGGAGARRRAASPGTGGRWEECRGVAPACAPLRAGPARPVVALASARGELPGDAARLRDRTSEGLITWAEVEAEQSLAEGYLPIPTVSWRHPAFGLDITAFAVGEAGKSVLVVRYRLSNPGDEVLPAWLYLAMRPLQVNPSTQFLGTPGGAATVERVEWKEGRVEVDGGRSILPLTPPSAFGAIPFDGGSIVERLRRGETPAEAAVKDPQRHASAVLAYDLAVPAGGTAEVDLAVPFHPEAGPEGLGEATGLPASGEKARDWVEREQAATAAAWRERLGRVGFTVPAAGRELIATLRSNLAYVLINRSGPALQPGARAYARSWIRDGALTSAALLRLGHAEEARAFVEWFAGHQYPSGKVPCCVDRRGADPVPEHDSAGELLYAVAEVFRFTGDREFARRMWPRVEGAVGYLAALRAERTTSEYRMPEKLAYFGLLPESISHEGYSDRPVHSYWDDFWALRGLKDAAWLAGELGEADAATGAERWGTLRDAFARDLYASLERTMAMHGIDYLPGSVEKGDFDATSTTIALAPGGELERLPEAPLRATFERYWWEFLARRDPHQAPKGDAYTPYELRSVGAFVRLGRRERAAELLAFFLGDRRPAGWNQWAEVVGRDPRAPRFLGDMPHTWVGSDAIRSILDLFAYERESDGALVVAAGIPAGWLAGDDPVGVDGLWTRWGRLTYRLERAGGRLGVRVEALAGGAGPPPGGVVLDLPPPYGRGRAWVDGGETAREGDGTVRLGRLPSTVEVEPVEVEPGERR